MSTARLVTTTLLAGSMAVLPLGLSTAQAAPSGPTPPDPVLQWDEIAANTVVKSGAFQNEGFLYMGYVSSAVYDAVRSTQDHDRADANGQKADAGAAVVEAAYDTLTNYFPAPRPTGSPDLDALHAQALAAIPDSPSKTAGIAAGAAAASCAHQPSCGRRAHDSHRCDLDVPDEDARSGGLPTHARRHFRQRRRRGCGPCSRSSCVRPISSCRPPRLRCPALGGQRRSPRSR